ncbi:MAG: Serine/threonine-protein kinase PknD [Phycisphaerae bacterium]|nr:Serine/threonine-protein kinase PknD [Phycisphaerae bacterium]
MHHVEILKKNDVSANVPEPPCSLLHDAIIQIETLRVLFPDYEFTEIVHEGGQGFVYQAFHTHTQRMVAIKVLQKGSYTSSDQRSRFSQEIEIISQLRHPHIVTLYHGGLARDRLFYTMEYIEGLSIDDYCYVNALSLSDTIELFIQVCEAVNYAHQQGILHRDLKPTNMIVDTERQARILDFGLAKKLLQSADSTHTLPGQVLGTLPYLNPEEVWPSKETVDTRSDIYSLGIVFYELLTGEFPYQVSGEISQVFWNIIHQEPAPLHQRLKESNSPGRFSTKEISADLEAIVQHTLAKEKHHRYQSVAALIDDLRRYLNNEAVYARQSQQFYLLKKALQKHRILVLTTLLISLIMISALITISVFWQRAEHIAEIAQAGLRMGAQTRLGSTARDEGRVDEALIMFETANKIAALSSFDPLIARFDFEAHLQQAQIYLDQRQISSAQEHAQAAGQLVDRLISVYGHDAEWQRLKGFSNWINGQILAAKGEWNEAIVEYEKSISIRRQLARVDNSNTSLWRELANVHAVLGKAYRHINNADQAELNYLAEYDIYLKLYDSNPTSLNQYIDILFSYNHLASWYISKNTPNDDRIALEWIERSDRLIKNVTSDQPITARLADIVLLDKANKSNSVLIGRRNTTRLSP